MRVIKYLAIILGVFIVLIAAVLAYVASTFDPNQYKPQIVQAVKERTHRSLKLEGDIKLAFFPTIGARLGRATLSEPESNNEFAGVEDLKVAVKLLPLLSKQVVVDAVEVKGLRANLVRHKDGKSNFEDLAAGSGPAAPPPKASGAEAPVKIDIDHIAIEDSALGFRDEAKGEQYALSKLNLKTGRVASGVPTRIDLSFAAQSNKPKLELAIDLKTRVMVDLERQVYSFEDLGMKAKGTAAGISDLDAKVSGNATAKVKTGEFSTDKLSIAVTGSTGKDKLDVKLEAPRLTFAADRASGEKVTVIASIIGEQGTTRANLTLPGIEGTMQAFKSSAMLLDLDLKRADLTLKEKVSSPLTGNIQARQLNLPKLAASIQAGGPNLPGKSLSGELAGSASVDAAKQHLQANLSGKVGDSNVKARIAVMDLTPLSVNFDADIDRLDIDRYLPQKAAGTPQKSASLQKQAEQPLDLSGLKNLNLNGKLQIGSLKASNVKAANVRLDVRAANDRLDINPLSATLYQGTLAGAVAVNASATPTFTVRQKLTGVSVGPLLKDLADYDMLEGRGNVAVDVTTQGNRASALKKALNGTAAVNLADGAVKGINIAGSIRNAQARLGSLKGEQTQQANKAEKTDFSELRATFNIKNGVAHNSDLSLKSPLIRVGGEGDVNIGEDSINYLVMASIVGTLKGQGGGDIGNLKGLTVPVRVSGPLAAPSYKLDFGSMVTEAAKQKVEQAVRGKLEERLGGGAAKDGSKGGSLQEGLKEGLKGLFGR